MNEAVSRRIQSCFWAAQNISPSAQLGKEDRRLAFHRFGISKVKEWFSMRRISMTFCSMPQEKLDLSISEVWLKISLRSLGTIIEDVKPAMFGSPSSISESFASDCRYKLEEAEPRPALQILKAEGVIFCSFMSSSSNSSETAEKPTIHKVLPRKT